MARLKAVYVMTSKGKKKPESKRALARARRRWEHQKKALDAMDKKGWVSDTNWRRLIKLGRRRVLLLYVGYNADNGKHVAMALESPVENLGASTAERAAAVFDNHSHQYIGEYDTLAKAAAAADRFADRYKARQKQKCKCGPIAKRVRKADEWTTNDDLDQDWT